MSISVCRCGCVQGAASAQFSELNLRPSEQLLLVLVGGAPRARAALCLFMYHLNE